MRKTLTRVFAALLCIAMLATCAFMASAAEGFSDVKSSNWFYDYVTYMADKGIINGYAEDGTFRPNNNVDRKEFITMMVNTFGLTATKSVNYNDVPDDSWYYSYYSKAAAQGFLTDVFTGNTMRPADELKREEAAALLMAYLDYPEDEKASTSKFEDYSEIDSDYRTYVLQAAKVGIIDGIEEDGELYFRPDQTLTRAQAAKILSVAAGTIASDDIEDELESDVSDNLIVTKACTIENVEISGNVIITEGATGTVNFISCDIEGTVSVRSKAKVVFSGGSVEELNLDVASAKIEVKQSVDVAVLNVYNPSATVSFSTSASVDEFNVPSGSTGVTVSGTSGEIDTLNVKANTFTSTIEPETVEIDSSVSATIGGVSYKDGVKGNISVTWTSGNEYLNFETYKNGTVKYYYTASSTAPTKTNFTTNYNNAEDKASITAKSGTAVKELLYGEAVSLEDFPYVAVALVDGSTVINTPVIINREGTKYGFTVLPTLSVSSNNDQLKGTAYAAGTIYYYYTNESEAPSSYTAAMNEYKATSTTIRGTVDCSATTFTKALKAVSAVEEYGYCVVFLLGSNNTQYQPVIIERPFQTNGLDAEPYILISAKTDGKDTLVITAPSSGTVKILYTNSTLNYTVSSFNTEYSAANKTPAEGELKLAYSGSVTANKETSITLAKSSDVTAKGYKYAVIQYGSNLPVRVARINDVDGFEGTTLPTVLKTTEKDIIVFTPISEATNGNSVKYMYVSANKAYTSESFEAMYKTVADNIKGEIPLTSGAMKELKSEKQSSNISEGYVVFMFIGTGRAYKPVTVARGAIGTGFVGTPVASYDVDTGKATVSFNAKVPFELEYFVIDKNTYSTETLANMFNYKRMPDDVTDITVNSILKSAVKQGGNDNVAITGVLKGDKYLAIRAKDVTIKYTPTIITIANVDDGIKGGATPFIYFNSTNGMIEIDITPSADAAGKTFEYYYTNTKPETTANYNSIFNGSGPSGAVTVTKTNSSISFEAGKWLDMAQYKYFVYRVVDSAGESMTPGYKELPLNYRANAKITADQNLQGQLNVAPYDTAKYTVYWFYSKTQLSVTISNFESTYKSTANNYCRNYKAIEASKANENQTIQTDFSQPTGTNATQYKYIYVCLKDANGKYYQPVELKVPGTYTE